MSESDVPARPQAWAQFRFAVVAGLLAAPPAQNDLREALQGLAAKTWKHPTKEGLLTVGFSTVERWYYTARDAVDPIEALRSKQRKDRGVSKSIHAALAEAIATQYADHPRWTYQLHYDNLVALARTEPAVGPVPSYSAVRRYMRANGMRPQPRLSARKAKERRRERRAFEATHVGGLWHLDFHHGSRRVLLSTGAWAKVYLLCILDDHSRLVCHAQWYLSESAENLAHGLQQAFEKCGLPYKIQEDNGSAMKALEVVQGLGRLGIKPAFIEVGEPEQNAKQESWWNPLEKRLLAMLDGVERFDLTFLNDVTQAWITYEYNIKQHRATGTTPVDRFANGPCVLRDCPDHETFRQVFGRQVSRCLRSSDGTIALDGVRFEVPSRYRHMVRLTVRYARWDLSRAYLVDPRNDAVVCTILPLDKAANADGVRRPLEPPVSSLSPAPRPDPAKLPPLLQELLDKQRRSGFPPPYLHKREKPAEDEENP